MNVDPLAEKYTNISPYAYVANNPVYFVDPDGREIRIFGVNGQVFTYTPGMEYDGDDNFISNIINYSYEMLRDDGFLAISINQTELFNLKGIV